MYPILETLPISEFRAHQAEVMAKVKKGPVVLAQHGRPALVLIDPARWNEMMEELEDLRDLATIAEKELAIERGELEIVDLDEPELEALDEVQAPVGR